jgi:hypothetical protein
MSLLLLKRGASSWQDGPVFHYLLLPILPTAAMSEQLIEVIILANIWRIRRNRPFGVAFVEDSRRTMNSYVESLDTRRIEGAQGERPLIFVGTDDLSPFAPRTDEDLLFFSRCSADDSAIVAQIHYGVGCSSNHAGG